MATTNLKTETKAANGQQPGRHPAVGIPMARHEQAQHIPVPPDHRSEQARRRSEAEQAAVDIAAGW